MSAPRKNLICAVLLATLFIADAAAGSYRIAGVAVNASTGAPVNRVRIVLSPEDDPDDESACLTGPDGKFAFPNLAAGKYRLTAQARGIPRQTFGQRDLAGGLGSLIAAGPDQDTGRLVFSLIPPAIISGKITDETGDPVPGAMIELFAVRVVEGRKRVTSGNHRTSTNDQGEYRFSNLPGGSYYVCATAHPWYVEDLFLMDRNILRDFGELGYAPRYYPNTADAATARTLTLKPAQEASADFSMAPARGVRVTVTWEEAKVSGGTLVVRAPGIAGQTVVLRSESCLNRKCELAGVLPGHYSFRLDSGIPLVRRNVEVGDSDLEVKLSPGHSATVTGSVATVNGPLAAVREGLVRLLPAGDGEPLETALASDGKFQFTGVPAGRYRAALKLAGYYLRAPTGPIEVPDSGPITLKLIAAGDGARVSGKVDREGRAVNGEIVVLAPQAAAASPADYRVYQTDLDGSFDFPAIRPGEYLLYAVEDGSGLEYAFPGVAARRNGKAMRLEPKRSYSVLLEPARN